MELVAIITLLAVAQYIVFAFMVGAARGKYGVEAPATTGHPEFERRYRVQMNTLEQLIIFLPALWLFGYYIGNIWAASLGAVFLVGRILYAVTYIRDPKTRAAGTLLSMIPSWVMVLGGLIGAVWQVLAS